MSIFALAVITFGRFRSSAHLLSRLRSGDVLSRTEQVWLVVLLSVPAIFAQMSNIVMEYIDASMVGGLGAEASAGVGLVATSCWLVWGLAHNSIAGFCVLISHLVGAHDCVGARSVLRQGMLFSFVVSIVLMFLGVVVSSSLPWWLGGSADICGEASDYFRIVSMALPVAQMTMLCSGALRGSGNVVVPSLVNVLMCVADVLLNYIFIYIVGMGVRGAALGTAVAQGVACCYLVWYICRRSKELGLAAERNEWRMFLLRVGMLRRVLRISVPMVVQHTLMTCAQVVGTTIVAPLGKMSLAANSFGINAESLCYMPGYGIADAAQTLVGQSIGAGRRELTKRFAYVSVGLGMGVMTAMGVVMYLCAPAMMALLTPVAQIRELGVEALRIEAWAEPMFAASIVCYGVFVGAGDTLKPCLMNLVSMWGVRLSLAWWLAPQMGLAGVWLAMCIELCFRGLIFLIRLKRLG